MKAESLYIQKLTYDENTGNEIIGLFPSEANPAIVSSYTYDAKRMGGAPTLTATIYSSEPLQWKKEEFVEYNDDRFFVSYTPSSTKDNSSKMWKSEITFTSRRELLDNTLFFDVVVDDVDTQNKDRYRSNQTKFTFGGTIHEFVARVNSSMAYCGLYRPTDEYKGYYVVVDEGYGTDEVKEVSFEDQYLTDVLQLINTTFELDYYWDGNVCHVGKVQHDLTDTPIKYGSSDALISVSKENANYKIVDMITGYGSSDNLPYYYPNDDEFGDAVFDVENINKDGVSIQLSKMVGCLGNANCYNNKLTLYNVINGKEVALKLNYASEFYWASSGESSSTDGQYSFGDNVRMFVDAKSGVHVDFSSLNIVCVYNGTGINGQYKLVTEQGVPRITIRWKNITTGEEGYVISDKNVGTTASMDIVSQGIYQFDVNYVLSYKSSSIRINTNGVVINLSAQKSDFTITKSGYLEMSYTPNYGNFVFKDAKGGKFYNLEDLGITMPILSSSEYYSAEYKFDSRKEDVNNSGSKVDVYYVGLHDADNGAENPVSITVIDRVWIAPSSVLMPSIYRNTKGAERFYYALNNTHKLPSGSGYYEFVNLYKKGNPHQGTVTFGNIKPTIKGIVNAEGQLFGEIADVAFDSADSDVKDSDGNYIHSYFYIKLHKFNGDFGFDLFAHALASESAKINLIKSNGCPACSFVIYNQPSADKTKFYNCVSVDEKGNLKPVRTDKNDYIFANASDAYEDKLNQDSTQKELWIAVQKDTSTLGIVMPNASAGFKPQKGDLFVITGIKPPKVLVTAAEKRLDDALIKHMSENNTDQFNYSVKFSRVFLQENTDFASKLNENAKLSIQIQGDSDSDGNLISHEVFVSNYSVKVDNDELAEVEIELVNSLEVTKSDTKQIIDAVKGETVKSLSSMVGGSNTNSFNASITDKMYLSKLKDDTANGTITFQKVQKFLQGLLVGGGSWTPDAEGRSHLITDYLEVRMKAIFEELVIKETSTIGGKEIISPAGGVVAHNVEVVTVTYNNVSQKAYRCYFLAEQEGDSVDNDFAIGDQVRSESFNVRKGTYHKVGNHFYWRLVIGRDEEPVELEGKKYHYIDLSDTDCATASDVPAKGDVLNQCGNRTDVERQNCLIFSAVDTYSPSISLYHGINSYSFANKEYVEYGVNKQTNKAFFNVYGDMYVGDRPTKENGYEGSSYIKYDSAAKQVSVKGKISAKSTVDGKELSQYIKENSAKGLTEEQVNNLIKNSQVITDLQNQVDGAIETWFYEGVPTLKNAPASSWATDKEKDTHLGDLYYDNKTGKAYRFAKDGNTYKWTIITDTDIAKALSDASKAQETADGKMKVFSTQPNPPYQVGDIWVNATYPADGSTYKNEVLRCQTAKGAGSQFAIGDWIKASKYTDDTVANAAKTAAEKAQKAAEKAQGDISKLGTTVTTNKKAFDSYVKDGYLEPSEIAAMAQDSKRLEDDFAAAQKSYNEVKGAEVLKSTKELTDLNTAFATLTTAKTELIKYLSDISKRYNSADTNGKATIVSAVGTKFTNFQSAYSAFYDKLGLANAYITSKIYSNLGVVIGDVTSLAYLKKALIDVPDTEINGGLVLTSLIGLRDTGGNTTAGINGITEKSAKGGGIAAWFGGEMVDKDYNDGSKTPANTIFRFDGSGYVAGGAIWWGTDGRVHADPTSFIISEKNLGAYLTFFEPTWKSGSAGTSVADLVSLKPNAPFSKLGVSGDATFEGTITFHGIKLTYDATNKAIKVDGNLYATGGITAYGAGTSSSSGGGLNGSVKSYSDALKLTSESLSEVASAYSIKALDSRISSLEGGSAMDVSVSGSGNAVTAISKSGTTIIVTKGTTFLTSHQSLASYLTKADAASLYQPKGNYLTAHQSLDGYVNAIAVSGSGNAVTAVTKSGKTITFTKGATYLTSHQSLSNYYTKSSVDSLLNDKSATTHTHSVKINGITKTIAASGGDAVDLGTYLTAHQSLAAYATQNWVKNEATAHNADMVDNYHASGLFTGFSISDVANKVTISIGGTSKALNLVRAFPSGVGNNFNDIATHGNSMGMSKIAAPYASSTANYQTLNGYVNPNGQTGWHHYINLSYTDSNNTETSPNMWQTQFAIKAGTTEVYVRSRAGGKISNDAAWAAPWVRLARVTDNVASASKVANALSWSGYSSGSYNGSAVKSISIPNNTNQLTNGAGFITSSASITGNAGSATKLQNARTINGTSFNGTANIVTSYWGTTRKLWGNSVNGNADVNGSITIANTDGAYVQIGDVRLVYDKANTAIKVVKSDGTTAANFYATGGISAYGEGSAGTTGSNNFSAKAYADSIKLTSENLSEIASAYSIAVLNNSLNAAIGRISTLEGGSATSIETTGSGNAVTSVSKSGTKITFTKGSTFSLNGHTHDFITVGANQTITATQYTKSRLSVRPYYSSGGPTTYGNILEVVSGNSGGGQLGMEWSGSQTKTDGTDTNVGKLYYRSKRDNMAGWTVWKRLAFAEELAWGNISGKPTSLSGYGITDGVNAVSVTGSGNAVTSISKSGTTISVVKGSTFSLSGHTHKWADITDRPSSLKNPSAISWSGYSSGSYDGSAAKSISIPNNTNQLTNGAGFITASASITGNAATATKVNHSLSVFGKSFNGSADVTVADTDLITSILTATANLTDKTEILTSLASDNGFNDSNAKNRIYRRPASAIWGYINSKTISNADKLDNVHLNGIFTALSNTNNGVSMTIGTVAKSLANMQVYSATKLVTARNIALNGDLMGNANFDGSANITINGYMSYCNATVSNTNTYPWRRIAKVNEITGNYSDGCILLYISEGFNGGYYGIARVYIRTDNLSTGANARCSIQWISRNGYGLDSLKIAMYKTTGKAYYDVFLKMRGAYGSVVIRTLQDQRGGLGKRFTLVNSTESTNAASHTEAYATIEDAATAIHNQAYTSIAQGSDVATVHNADMVDGIHANGLFTNLSNSGNSLSITVGGTNKTLTVNYASNAGNADTLDGVHASGLFTNLSNSGNNISITIGGTNKTLTAAYATNCDTVDGYHAQLGSSKPYGKIPVIGTDGVIELGHYIDFHHDNTTGSDYSVRLQTNGNHSNVVTLPTATGTLALTSGNVASATKLQTARTIWGQSFNGTANVSGALSGATTISASNTISTTLQNGALKIGNKLTPISAIDAQVIFNTGAAIRFGEKNWNWDEWAGLKYTHSNKTVYLGIADGSVFNANNAQSYGKLQLKAIDSILFDSDSDSFQIHCDNSNDYLRIGSSDNSGYVLVSDIGNWDTDDNGDDTNNWLISIDGSGSFKRIYCPGIYTADSIPSTPNKALLLSGNVIREYHRGGSPYYSSITFKDTTLALSAYGNIGLTSTQGITIDGGSGTISMVASGGFDVTYRAASLGVSQTGASEYTWTFNNGSIKTTGGITAYQSSDERLKHNIHGVDSLAIIKAMGGTVAFRYNEDDKASIGWIAQRVLHNTLMQDLVEKDEDGYLKINYWSPKLIAVAFGAIEQVDDEVAKLKARVRELENEVEQLKSDRL